MLPIGQIPASLRFDRFLSPLHTNRSSVPSPDAEQTGNKFFPLAIQTALEIGCDSAGLSLQEIPARHFPHSAS